MSGEGREGNSSRHITLETIAPMRDDANIMLPRHLVWPKQSDPWRRSATETLTHDPPLPVYRLEATLSGAYPKRTHQ